MDRTIYEVFKHALQAFQSGTFKIPEHTTSKSNFFFFPSLCWMLLKFCLINLLMLEEPGPSTKNHHIHNSQD